MALSIVMHGKRGWAIGVTSAALAVGGVPLSIAMLQSHGISIPGVPVSKTLLAMLEDRSPGERTQGQLSQTKQKKMAERGPTERALGKINRPRESTKEFVDAIARPPADILAAPGDVPIEKAVAPTQLAGLPIIGGAIVPAAAGGGGGVGGGGGGGGGGTSGGVTETPVTPVTPVVPVVPAVPEPGTWMTMILGFGMIGLATRRRRYRLSFADGMHLSVL